mmetsp:Transcript_17046/g.24109  ORF Transcript_17046/g.24109 Transcript_17046/m.24109 type:complete len:737 (+) Transcript_17046:320-2530(+)
MQLSFNPNVALTSRPLLSLTVACLTNTIQDVDIVSDHTRPGCALGVPTPTGEISGDAAIARYLSRRPAAQSFGGSILLGTQQEELQSMIDQWVDYAQKVSRTTCPNLRLKAIRATLDRALERKSYIVGHSLTLADIALFAAMNFPSRASDYRHAMSIIQGGPTARWLDSLRMHPAIMEATQLAVGISAGSDEGENGEACFQSDTLIDPLVKGMDPLLGATPGNVVTRFPPEPSGYLHVGHAKAVLMNEYYARRYKGRLIVRFDDTNPSKEKEEFQSSILSDLGKLNVSPDVVTFTSDYFNAIQGYARFLIDNSLAFMDDTPQEQMQKERMERIESKHRNQTPEECLKLFALMASGKEDGAKYCLRAKIDMSSVNGTMRDPVIYRQNTTPHHRSGTTFKVYPTYDLACPIVDSIEGVTHALRTTEYNDRDEQYAWFQSALNLRRSRIHSFARMDFRFTELSKRKLTWFVEQGHVTGWDDARFPTVRGVIRRGVNVTALRKFICSQGASRRIVNMEWNKFWAENKKEIDLMAKRFMAIDSSEHVPLTITNGPAKESNTYIGTDYLPKDPEFGKRAMRLASSVLLEKVDVDGVEVGEEIVLMRWGVVKLTSVSPTGLEGTYIPDGNFKAAKRKLSWIADVKENISVVLTEFDNLISKEKLEEGEDFKDFVNPNTLATTVVIGDPGLKTLQKDEIIQLERRGYYRVDQPYINDDKGLVLFTIPDGKSKSMSGLGGKLAHR